MVPAVSIRISRVPTYSGYQLCTEYLHVRDYHPLRSVFPGSFHFIFLSNVAGPSTPITPKRHRFGLFPVRSPLLRESLLFSFPPGTKMFQFPGLASSNTGYQVFILVGCPIRKSADVMDICSSPQLIAACHVFRRL